MRRFEYVEGTSSKFWSAEVDGETFVVVYGRIGTPGTRKEKAFSSVDEAQRECDKKVAEKLREGYVELGAQASAAPTAAPAPTAPSAHTTLPPLPPRTSAGKASKAAIDHAAEALIALESELGGRSWRVARFAHAASRALRALHGIDPKASPALASVLDGLMDSVTAAGPRRLPLAYALDLLHALDPAAFTRALSRWKPTVGNAPSPALTAVRAVADALQDPELGLRATRLLAARPDHHRLSEGAWTHRWNALAPHLRDHLRARKTTWVALLGTLDATGDEHLGRRITRMSTP